MPPKISDGQWTPQKILAKQTSKVTTMAATANGTLNNNSTKETPKKNAAWPDGNAGWFGFFISEVMGKTSTGRLR